MPRTALTKTTSANYGVGLADAGFEAVDQSNGNTFVNTGKTILLVANGSGGNVVVTATTPANGSNNETAIAKTLTVAAGDTGFFGPYLPAHWNQTGGLVNIDYDTGTSITAAVVELEPTPS